VFAPWRTHRRARPHTETRLPRPGGL